MKSSKKKQTVAIVGAGVAGLTAAYLLSKKYNVIVFEKNAKLGGHANTIKIPSGPDKGLAIDTGFIVFNEQNYPVFCRLLDALNVPSVRSDMSFSFHCPSSGMLYSSDVPFGLFGRLINILSIPFYRFIADIIAFNKHASIDLASPIPIEGTLDDYLNRYNFSSKFRNAYVIPMGAAIWSASYDDTLAMPAHTFLHFWRNHGLLQIKNRPQWRTLPGGSQTYVSALQSQLPDVRTNMSPSLIRRSKTEVTLLFKNAEPFLCDKVVVATHADEALKLLENPSEDESRLLGAWSYSKNPTVLHTDQRLLPPKKRCWASWNYFRSSASQDSPVSVSYYMNRLQPLPTKTPYVVTLNSAQPINQAKIITEMVYTHPCFTQTSIATQQELPTLNGQQHTYFCGSYFKYGFHEDAAASGAAVATQLGASF